MFFIRGNMIKNKESDSWRNFYDIQNEVIDLNRLFQTYMQIFAEENDLVIKSSSFIFFQNLKKILIDSMTLSISRLFDPPGKNKNKETTEKNLSFYQLLLNLENQDFPLNILVEFKKEIKNIDDEIRPTIIHYRNKHIGHNDLDTVRIERERRIIIPIFSIADIGQIIARINNLVNSIPMYFVDNYFINFEGMDPEAHIIMSLLKNQRT
jgi:hypothetical protein